MPQTALSAVVARVGRAVRGADLDADRRTDGQLLGRFVAARDGEAFAELVRRLGPMVLGVCRRTAGDDHLADDAFQAAFLVLARRAAAVRPREAVRGFLYGVAVRTAREARRMSARRRARELPVPAVPDRPTPLTAEPDADALRVLDDEVARLPDRLRAAVLLCELDGLSRKDAAVRLGVAEGTLSSRLATARKLLAERLKARGVAIPVIGLAALLTQSATAVPGRLLDAAGGLAAPELVPTTVTELARKVFRTMLLTKLKRVAAGTLAVAAAGWAVAAGWTRPARAEAPPPAPATSRPDPAAAGPGRIFFAREGELAAVNPDGTRERRVPLPLGAAAVACPSPDGKRIAFWKGDGSGSRDNTSVHVRWAVEAGDGDRYPVGERFGFILACWSADGSTLYVNLGGPTDQTVRHLKIDVAEKKLTRLDGLKRQIVTGTTADGKRLLTTGVGDGEFWQPKSLHLVDPDGGNDQVLTRPDDRAMMGKLSPDGKRVLCTNHGKLSVVEVGRPESMAAIADPPEGAEFVGYAWAPDGRRVVYLTGRAAVRVGEISELESRLVVAGADGRNPKVLRSAAGQHLTGVDWR